MTFFVQMIILNAKCAEKNRILFWKISSFFQNHKRNQPTFFASSKICLAIIYINFFTENIFYFENNEKSKKCVGLFVVLKMRFRCGNHFACKNVKHFRPSNLNCKMLHFLHEKCLMKNLACHNIHQDFD